MTTKLYRGITTKNLPGRYPGAYYTEFLELAQWYAKKGGQVIVRSTIPRKPFDIDTIAGWSN